MGWAGRRDGPLKYLGICLGTKIFQKPGGASNLAGPQAVERCKLAMTCHRGTEQQTAWCDLATAATWEGLEEKEAVLGAGPWWSYVSPFSMRPSCSSRRLIRSPCSLTSTRSARSSCITSSSFPASPAPARLPLGTSGTAIAVEAPERL